MDSDRTKWNARYREGDIPGETSDIVRRFSRLASGPRALDLAAGAGRNATFLAGHGFRVDAVDISDEGLSRVRHPGVRRICADLDGFDIPAGRYDLIVDVLYLNRRLFPQMINGLRPGGLLVFESLLLEPGQEAGGHCRDYFLRPNELLRAFLALRVLHYREGPEPGADDGRQLASLVARRV
ncbi:MAG: class I SAM-dependent methyltransferase [Desulfobacterales bacterium]|jgi:SAM-dependent methyltransferase|nr:class I SAM-dependent methyltransferase [Desulfobacterales bacterium]